MATVIKTSQKECNELADLVYEVSGKCCEFLKGAGARTCEVWFDGECYECKSNTEAYEFMGRILVSYDLEWF